MTSGHSRLSTRHRLAIIGVAGVVVTMIAAIVSFNAFEHWNIEREATSSLDEALGWEAADGIPATRVADYLELDGNLELVPFDDEVFSTLENELAAWCAQNRELDVVRQVELLGRTLYVEMNVGSWDLHNRGYTVAYIDVTLQRELVRTVNCVLALILLVGSVLAGCAGWRVGRRIESAEESQKHLFENVSHELKTPLAAIRGYAEGMTAGVVEPGHAALAITRETDRMARLVEQILDLSRIDSGVVEPHLASVEIADLVQDCLMPFEGVVRMRGLHVSLDLAAGVVEVDEDLMGHALENVLSNAVRHALSVVNVGFDGHELWVENDGTLPEPDELDSLFERFRTGEGGSTGIGLALAREIAVLHGWQPHASLHDGLLRMTFVVA